MARKRSRFSRSTRRCGEQGRQGEKEEEAEVAEQAGPVAAQQKKSRPGRLARHWPAGRSAGSVELGAAKLPSSLPKLPERTHSVTQTHHHPPPSPPTHLGAGVDVGGGGVAGGAALRGVRRRSSALIPLRLDAVQVLADGGACRPGGRGEAAGVRRRDEGGRRSRRTALRVGHRSMQQQQHVRQHAIRLDGHPHTLTMDMGSKARRYLLHSNHPPIQHTRARATHPRGCARSVARGASLGGTAAARWRRRVAPPPAAAAPQPASRCTGARAPAACREQGGCRAGAGQLQGSTWQGPGPLILRSAVGHRQLGPAPSQVARRTGRGRPQRMQHASSANPPGCHVSAATQRLLTLPPLHQLLQNHAAGVHLQQQDREHGRQHSVKMQQQVQRWQ